MKKIGMVLGLLLVLVAAAAAALPWYLGMEAEEHIREAIAERSGANSPFAVKLVQYERGWLQSTALHRVSLKADPAVYFDIHHDIDQLPDPHGLVRMRSTPRWPQQVQAAADYYFAKQPAVTVDTVVDFERNVAVRISSPAFSRPLLTQPDVKLSWGGAPRYAAVYRQLEDEARREHAPACFRGRRRGGRSDARQPAGRVDHGGQPARLARRDSHRRRPGGSGKPERRRRPEGNRDHHAPAQPGPDHPAWATRSK